MEVKKGQLTYCRCTYDLMTKVCLRVFCVHDLAKCPKTFCPILEVLHDCDKHCDYFSDMRVAYMGHMDT